MSMHYQPPPREPKTTDTGTIFGVLALVFFGIPIGLCVLGGIVLWGLAGFPAGKGFGSNAKAWQEVVDFKKSQEQEMIAMLQSAAAQNGGTIPISDIPRLTQKGHELDAILREKINATQRSHGNPSAEVRRQLLETPNLDAYLAQAQVNRPDPFAQQRVEQEQRMAQIRAEQQQREQQAAAQRLADQQAREQRLREFSANVPPAPVFNPPPQPFNPPPQPFNPPPQPSPQPQADQPPPGFPATDLAQIKPKDIVFVQANGQWHEVLVQLKRGKIVQVRSLATGGIETVTLERIRLKNEPTAKPTESNLPPALQVAKSPNRSNSKDKDEEGDDALFVAKPPGDPTATEAAAPQTAGAPIQSATKKPAAPPAEYRTWTNDTGEFKVEAELVSCEFDQVQLRKRDGKVLSLPIGRLSAADQALIRAKFP